MPNGHCSGRELSTLHTRRAIHYKGLSRHSQRLQRYQCWYVVLASDLRLKFPCFWDVSPEAEYNV